MKKVLPSVSVVIVNYNGRRWLTDCLRSLRQLVYPQDRLQVIMVDNGSKDDSITLARKTFPKVRIIRSERNNYCYANNLGIKAAKGEYVAFLNNDTQVDKNWIKELVKVMESDEKIGGVGGKIFFMDGKLNSTGHMELPDFYWTDRGFAEKEKGQYDTQEEMGSITNAASLYRKASLNDVGSFDEDFNMYLEDVDIGIRLRQKGWKIVYCPKGIVRHQVHGTATLDQVFLGVEKNRLLLLAKHYPEKLGDSLLGRGYFSNPKEHPKAPGLADVMPRIVSKLQKHHGVIMTKKVLPALFLNLKKETNLRVHNLILDLNYEKNRADGKEKELGEKSRELEAWSEKSAKAALLEKELRAQQAALTETIRVREEETLRLRGESEEKNKELKKQLRELEGHSGRLAQYELIEKGLRAQQVLLENNLAAQRSFLEEEKRTCKNLENALRIRDEEAGHFKGELEEKSKELKERLHEIEAQSGKLAQYGLLEKEFRVQQALWESNLASQKALLGEEKKIRKTLEDAIKVREEESGHLRAELESKNKELGVQERELEARGGRLELYEISEKDLRARVETMNKELGDQGRELEARAGRLAQYELMEKDLRTQLEVRDKELGVQERELESRAGRLTQFENLERDLRAQIDAKDQDLGGRWRELEGKNCELGNLSRTIEDKNRELGDRWRELEGKNWEMGNLSRTIEDKNRELGDRWREIEGKNRELGEQWRELEARAERLRQYELLEKELRERQIFLESTVLVQEEEIKHLKAELEEKEKEFDEQSKELARYEQVESEYWAQQAIWEEKFGIQQTSLEAERNACRSLKEELEKKTLEAEVLDANLIRTLKSRDALQKEKDDFYASTSFRYFIGPVWRALNRLKDFKRAVLSIGKRPKNVKDRRERVLFIKPQRVSVDEARWKINDFKSRNPDVKVCVLANLTQEDYDRMFPDADLMADERFFYSPKVKKFGFWEKIKFLINIRKKKIRQAIILVAAPAYRGYKLALILALFTGAKKVEVQRVQEGTDIRAAKITKEFLGVETFKDVLLLPFRALLIVAVVVWFVLFIVTGIQWRKFLYQFQRPLAK